MPPLTLNICIDQLNILLQLLWLSGPFCCLLENYWIRPMDSIKAEPLAIARAEGGMSPIFKAGAATEVYIESNSQDKTVSQ